MRRIRFVAGASLLAGAALLTGCLNDSDSDSTTNSEDVQDESAIQERLEFDIPEYATADVFLYGEEGTGEKSTGKEGTGEEGTGKNGTREEDSGEKGLRCQATAREEGRRQAQDKDSDPKSHRRETGGVVPSAERIQAPANRWQLRSTALGRGATWAWPPSCAAASASLSFSLTLPDRYSSAVT